MRQITIALATLVLVMVTANVAISETVKGFSKSWNVWGHAHATWLEDDGESFSRIRLRSEKYLGADGKVRLFAEIAFEESNFPSENWLQQAFVEVRANEKTKLRIGRIFLGSGLITPAPHHTPTVKYPKAYPFGVLAWGVQGHHKLGAESRLTLDWDVSGLPSKAFDSDENFDEVSVGFRFKRVWSWGHFGLSELVLSNSVRSGVDFSWGQGDLTFEGGVFHNSALKEDSVSATMVAELKPNRWFAPHLQVEYVSGKEHVTAGVRTAFDESEYLQLIVDYDFDQQQVQVLGRIFFGTRR